MDTSNDRKLKFIIIGDSDVGKTTLFWRFTEGDYLERKDSTVTAVDFKIKQVEFEREPIRLYIWDTAGQERYRSIVATFFKGCHGIALVFDQTRPDSFENLVSQWWPLCQSKTDDAKAVVVGSKCDLGEEVSQERVKQWCEKTGVKYFRSSSKDNINVTEPFMELVRLNLQTTEPAADTFVKAESFDIGKMAPKKTKKKCC